jgi:hypothetical protein
MFYGLIKIPVFRHSRAIPITEPSEKQLRTQIRISVLTTLVYKPRFCEYWPRLLVLQGPRLSMI